MNLYLTAVTASLQISLKFPQTLLTFLILFPSLFPNTASALA